MESVPASPAPAPCERDSQHWVGIIRVNHRLIASYMRRVTRDPTDVDDLIASAVAIAWEAWAAGEAFECERAWLVDCCRKARSSWAMSRQSDRAQAHIEAEEIPAAERDDAFVFHNDEELVDDAWDALRQLPPRQREAVLYRVIFSWSVATTASAMGCKDGTVKAHLHAGLRNLRMQLAPSRD